MGRGVTEVQADQAGRMRAHIAKGPVRKARVARREHKGLLHLPTQARAEVRLAISWSAE